LRSEIRAHDVRGTLTGAQLKSLRSQLSRVIAFPQDLKEKIIGDDDDRELREALAGLSEETPVS